MPGYEVYDALEQQAVTALFELNGGILFAHGFDEERKGVYRVREFETALQTYFGFSHVQAVSSGSAALKLALLGIGIRPGDEVIIPAHTFIATAEAVLETGAQPVVVDIDETLNMAPEALEAAITSSTRAVVVVHMMGEVARMDDLDRIARQNGLMLVEDCAQAIGAKYRGRWAGSFGQAAAFSTDGGKTLCTGEGGFVGLSDPVTFRNVRARHDHGHAYAEGVPRGSDCAVTAGFNYRMTEIQAAIGLVQLSKLHSIIGKQKENKKKVLSGLDSLAINWRHSPDPDGDTGDSVVLLLDSADHARATAEGLERLGFPTKNLPSAMRWHFADYWRHLPLRTPSGLQQSQNILSRCVALGIRVKMTSGEINRVVDAISNALAD